jgi:hypothetical protein
LHHAFPEIPPTVIELLVHTAIALEAVVAQKHGVDIIRCSKILWTIDIYSPCQLQLESVIWDCTDRSHQR